MIESLRTVVSFSLGWVVVGQRVEFFFAKDGVLSIRLYYTVLGKRVSPAMNGYLQVLYIFNSWDVNCRYNTLAHKYSTSISSLNSRSRSGTIRALILSPAGRNASSRLIDAPTKQKSQRSENYSQECKETLQCGLLRWAFFFLYIL